MTGMLCKRCGLEMRITGKKVCPEKAEDGQVKLVQVNTVSCVNAQCPRKGAMAEHKTVLWQGRLEETKAGPEGEMDEGETAAG